MSTKKAASKMPKKQQQNKEELKGSTDDKLRLPDPSWRLRAKDELGETEQVRNETMQTLKELIKGDHRLQCPLNEEFLIMFLRVTKFKPDVAFARLKRLAQLATTVDHWESQVDVSVLEDIFQKSTSTVAEQLDPSGRKVVVSLMGCWDPSTVPVETLIVASAVLLLALAVDDARVQVGGFTIIVDHKGFGLRHAMQMRPSILRLLSSIVKDCCPVRLKEIHLTNVSKVVQILFTVVSPLVGSKMRQRMFLHGGDLSAVREKLSAELLPAEFGGTCPSFSQSSYCYNIIKRAEQRGLLEPLRQLRYLKED